MASNPELSDHATLAHLVDAGAVRAADHEFRAGVDASIADPRPYRVTDTAVEILRVYHTAQRWSSRLDELQAGEVK